MGIFSALFGEKPKEQKPSRAVENPVVQADTEAASIAVDGEISPELIVVLAAAAYAVLTAEQPGISFKITRISRDWAAVGRQKLMDSRQKL